MTIDGKTKVLGIFGDPIAHSLSPRMQNAAITAAGFNAFYVPFHVAPNELASAVNAIRALGLAGVNLTIPHKEAVLPLLDEIDSAAAMIGAVNTVVNKDGHLVGYNTDATGFLVALQNEITFAPAGREVVLLGAGGAARAAIVALAREGAAKITISNRTVDKAENLRREFTEQFPDVEMRAVPLVEMELMPFLTSAELLVNTTAIGLHNESFSIPMVEHLPPKASLYDMVYASELTPLQHAADKLGLPFADGRGMLAGQGAEAFSLWFDTDPPFSIMRSAIAE